MEKKKARARVIQRNRDGTRFIKEALKKPGCRDRGGGVAKERERERISTLDNRARIFRLEGGIHL